MLTVKLLTATKVPSLTATSVSWTKLPEPSSAESRFSRTKESALRVLLPIVKAVLLSPLASPVVRVRVPATSMVLLVAPSRRILLAAALVTISPKSKSKLSVTCRVEPLSTLIDTLFAGSPRICSTWSPVITKTPPLAAFKFLCEAVLAKVRLPILLKSKVDLPRKPLTETKELPEVEVKVKSPFNSR